MISKLGINVIFSGSYSYDAAPIELFFALFKSGDLFEQSLETTGK